MRRILLSVIFASILSACAHSIHEVHVSDFDPMVAVENGSVVRGYGEQFAIMGIVGNTDYVNQAYNEIMAACKGGSVTGITTQLSTSLNFFSWTNKALMQGVCVTR